MTVGGRLCFVVWLAGCLCSCSGLSESSESGLEGEVIDAVDGESLVEDVPASRAQICDPESYNLDCGREEEASFFEDILNAGNEFSKEVLESEADKVTNKEQDDIGEDVKGDVFRKMPEVPQHPDIELLRGLLRRLLSARDNPSGIDYNIYAVRSNQINAFTIGGEIFVTTSMLKEVESNDELACIIGHEIGHNELRHIAYTIAKQRMAEDLFGKEGGELAFGFGNLVTMGFNQKNELESDFYGVDLALASGFEACRGIDFWTRMSNQETKGSGLDEFFRSHPYSEQRAECYKSHLLKEHNHDCDK